MKDSEKFAAVNLPLIALSDINSPLLTQLLTQCPQDLSAPRGRI